LFCAAIVVAVGVAAASGGRHDRAPSNLTAYGRLVWNFEGLLRRTVGTAAACEAANGARGGPSLNWTRSACSRAEAYKIGWQPVFGAHSTTTYTLTTALPSNLGNVILIRIRGRYIHCGEASWLVETNGGGWFCLHA
jgi:hypothetical protein